jgi:hypothetical protein
MKTVAKNYTRYNTDDDDDAIVNREMNTSTKCDINTCKVLVHTTEHCTNCTAHTS